MANPENASIDQNFTRSLLAASSTGGTLPVKLWADPTTHRLLVDSTGGGGSGTVTSVSVNNANGFTATVATPTTTPAITLGTSVSGVLKGNGTAISTALNSDLPSMTATVGGAVPTPPNNTTTFLRGDGTFATPAGSGTVTSASVATANGFAGTVANATTAAVITIQTTVNSPVLAGDGTAISAATTSGTGATVLLQNSPTLVSPALGTPTSVNLINGTGLPFATGVTGLVGPFRGGTGVANATNSTLTFQGTAATTFIMTGTTAVGFPLVGTLATLAGAETFTNKTVTSSTNNVTAKSLFSASTTIDVAAATAPTSGQVLTATGGTTATWQTPSGGGGITWTEVTGASQTAAVNNGYITNNAGVVTVTLPTTAAVGSVVRVAGSGAGGWKVAQNTGEQINFGNQSTTLGTSGTLASVNRYDAVELLNIVANDTWTVISSQGNITVS